MKKRSKKWYIILGSGLFALLGGLEVFTGFLNNSFQIFDRIKSDKEIVKTVDSTKNTPSNNKKVIIKSNIHNKSDIGILNIVKEATDYKNRGLPSQANSEYWKVYNKLTDSLKNYYFEIEIRTKSFEVQNNEFESFFTNLNIK